MPDLMIECDGLTKRFGHFAAVDHVSFSVARGSIFGFLGPNGSGKSTVIRMLCGILEPTEGTASIGGHDVGRESEAIKEMIGYMSQKFSLYDELTVSENLTFSGKLYSLRGKELKKRRDELIAITHLEPYLHRRAGLLSGGSRRSTRSCTKWASRARRSTRSARRSRTFSFRSPRNTPRKINGSRPLENQSSKLQAPSSREAPNTKLQIRCGCFDIVWLLEF